MGTTTSARGWRTRLVWGVRLLLAVALVTALVLLVRRIGLGALWRVLREASLAWLVLALAGKVLVGCFASLRFQRLTRPWVTLRFGRAAGIMFASYAATHLFGAALSPAYRAFALARERVSAGAAVTLVGLEKYLELSVFVVLLMPVTLSLGVPASFQGTTWAWLATLAGCAVIATLLWVVGRRSRSGRLGRMAAGLAALHHGGHLRVSVLLTVLLLLSDLGVLCASLHAVGAPADLRTALFGFLGAQLAFAIPGPPSSIGALETGVVVTLGANGVDAGQALAAALLYHAVRVLVELPVGLPPLRATAWRPWREDTRGAVEGRAKAQADARSDSVGPGA